MYHDTTNMEPIKSVKANTVLFMDNGRGVVVSMVNVDEIEQGEFVDYSLSKY